MADPSGTGETQEPVTPAVAQSNQAEASMAPKRQGLVLAALILVAAVANLNLAVANVALPDIGKAFNASQTALGLAAVVSLTALTPSGRA